MQSNPFQTREPNILENEQIGATQGKLRSDPSGGLIVGWNEGSVELLLGGLVFGLLVGLNRRWFSRD